jgi:hypothetical protein
VVAVLSQRQGGAGALSTAAEWLPAASASQTVVAETRAAASGARPGEPKSVRTLQLSPMPIVASGSPVSPGPRSTSQV